jgi:protocatechuate 3,4-dioxygenase alpha subunit
VIPQTPSQTVGPFFSVGLDWPHGPLVVPEGTPGAVRVHGTILDGAGEPVPDAMVETWQADPQGRIAHPDDPRWTPPAAGATGADGPAGTGAFHGFGRCGTDAEGRFWFRTVKPGPLPTPEGAVEAPHLNISVFGRGLLDRLVTRLYFPDEAEANAADPVLTSIQDPHRRATLVATEDADGLRFDIRLQGEHETVFFAL